ncbi:MAG: hypothetical protein PHS02_01750 [Candidatus ainarchaeum sp.]|nr:hypothetical protein [Candidatus ainarchaeum sp.]
MSEYGNVTLADIYAELKEVKRHVQHLENAIIPEEKLNGNELKKLDRLRAEALREHLEGKTVKIEDL